MSKDNKTNLKADHAPAMSTQTSKRQLLANFINFMAWVIGIGLLLSLVACQQTKQAADKIQRSYDDDGMEGKR